MEAKPITTDHIARLAVAYARKQQADNARYALSELDLLMPVVHTQLDAVCAEYEFLRKMILNTLMARLPRVIQDNFPCDDEDNYYGSISHHTFNPETGKLKVKFGHGWISLHLIYDIEQCTFSLDTFGLSVDRTELEPIKQEMQDALDEMVSEAQLQA